VSPEGAVTLLDPGRAAVGRAARLDGESAIDNIVAWVDGGKGRPKARVTPRRSRA
jgi:hypothetical protein